MVYVKKQENFKDAFTANHNDYGIGKLHINCECTGKSNWFSKSRITERSIRKIQLEVKTDLEKEGQAEVLVYMRDQVDTEMIAKATKAAVSNYMTPYNTKMEVRKGVLEALKDKADLTQG